MGPKHGESCHILLVTYYQTYDSVANGKIRDNLYEVFLISIDIV